MTMNDNIHGMSYQLKLNDKYYHAYYHIGFNANFDTQFSVSSIIHFINSLSAKCVGIGIELKSVLPVPNSCTLIPLSFTQTGKRKIYGGNLSLQNEITHYLKNKRKKKNFTAKPPCPYEWVWYWTSIQ